MKTLKSKSIIFGTIIAGLLSSGSLFASDNITIEKTGDAFINLKSDTDNVNENDNAYISLSQDNGTMRGVIGLTGNTNLSPDGGTYNNTITNSLLIGTKLYNSNSYAALQFGTHSNVRMTILPNGQIGMGTANTHGHKLAIDGTIGATQIKLSDNFSDDQSLSISKDQIYIKSEVPYCVRYATISKDKIEIKRSCMGDSKNGETIIESSNITTKDGNFSGTIDANTIDAININSTGNMQIGNSNSSADLSVYGKIFAKEVEIKNIGADYVFADDYELRPLAEVKDYIETHNHLPEIAPASITEQGVNLGEFNEKLLQKIEELTLYVINQQEEIETLKSQIKR